jgi:hypothetical protein
MLHSLAIAALFIYSKVAPRNVCLYKLGCVQVKEKVCATAETIYRETRNKYKYGKLESIKQSAVR